MADLPTDAGYVLLDHRGVLVLDGPDRVPFLQGLVSNDVTRVTAERTVYALFLTPQGRFLFDLFIAAGGAETLWLDAEADRCADLLRRLRLYRLRARIGLADGRDRWQVAALIGPGILDRLELPAEPGHTRPFGGGIACVDPRHPDLGVRVVLPRADAGQVLAATGLPALDFASYDRLRLALGVPDGSRDLPVEKAIPLENNLDALNAIAWDKGCYMGQELTARTRYRGLVRKRLLPVAVDGPLPGPGTPVRVGDREVGEMRSGRDTRALALLRLEELAKAEAEGLPLTAGDARLTALRPAWLPL